MGRPEGQSSALVEPALTGKLHKAVFPHSQPVSVAARSIESSAALTRPHASRLDWLDIIGAQSDNLALDPNAVSSRARLP
jgi:hypothetical protein